MLRTGDAKAAASDPQTSDPFAPGGPPARMLSVLGEPPIAASTLLGPLRGVGERELRRS